MRSSALSPLGLVCSGGRLPWAWVVAAVIGAVLVAALSGCRMTTLIERLADDEKEAVAQRYLQLLVDRDFSAIERELDPALPRPELHTQLEAMRGLLPGESPLARNLVGYYVTKSMGGLTRYDLTYQLDYGTAWLLAYTVWTEDAAGNRVLLAFRLQPLSEPLQTTHALNFARAKMGHYVFSALAGGVFAFGVVSLVACARTKFPRRKWLWVLFVLVGVGQVTFNWTTGQIGFVPISVQVLSVGLSAPSVYAPWTLSVSLPLGAVLFWFKRRRLLRGAQPPPIPSPVAG